MNNFDSIELPSLAQPLHMCNAILTLRENLVVCCHDSAQSVGIFHSVRPIVRISSAWRSRNVPASAHFAIWVFRKMNEELVLSLALSEVGFAGGCAEKGSARGGSSTSAGETSVELGDPAVNPSVIG